MRSERIVRRESMTACLALMGIALSACRAEPSSPLSIAAAKGDAAQVRELLAGGADPDIPDATGWSPLHWAARGGHMAAIQVLLAGGADPDLTDIGHNDWTPLLHAIHRNQPAAARALLEGGADGDGGTADRLTPLIMAAGYGYTDMVDMLLAAGADPYVETECGLNALTVSVAGVSDIDRFTLGSCQTATVRSLLERAPDLKLSENFAGSFARFLARWSGCREVVALLEGRP